MPLAAGLRSPSRFDFVNHAGPASLNSAIRSVASNATSSCKHLRRSDVSPSSRENKRVVRQETLCAGSLRVRSCKFLWKPMAFQLMDTITSYSNDEKVVLYDSDGDLEEVECDAIDQPTRPTKTHHYSLIFYHRSLLGHACRSKLDLDDTRARVKCKWDEGGNSGTFDFSIEYGSSGPIGRRRTLTCRARDANDYLLWTQALSIATGYNRKNKDSKFTEMDRCTFADTVMSSDSQLHSQESTLEQLTLVPTSPTAATAAQAVAPPEASIAEKSALKPVPAAVAAAYGVGRQRRVSIGAKPTSHIVQTRLQRRKQPARPVCTIKPSIRASERCNTTYRASRSTAVLSPFNTPYSNRKKRTHSPDPMLTTSRPATADQPCQASSSAAHPQRYRVQHISISSGAHADSNDVWKPHTPKTKRNRLLASASNTGALPLLQSPSSLSESPLDFVDCFSEHSTPLAHA